MGLAVLAVFAAGALAAPAPAGAASSAESAFSVSPRVYLSARAPAGGGYRMRLDAIEVETSESNVSEIEAGKRPPLKHFTTASLVVSRPGESALYFSRASFGSDGGLRLGLGSLGRVAARFVPARVSSQPVPGDGICAPSVRVVEHGSLRGTISFRGEGGFARVRRAAIPATLDRAPARRCRFHFPKHPSPPPPEAAEGVGPAQVGGLWRAGHGRWVDFSADPHPALGFVGLRARSDERRGHVSVYRSVFATAPIASLSIDRVAHTATFTAAVPFHGSARFAGAPGRDSGSWLGSLGVDFPGEPGVRLAGSRFDGELSFGGSCGAEEFAACLEVTAPHPTLGPRHAARRP